MLNQELDWLSYLTLFVSFTKYVYFIKCLWKSLIVEIKPLDHTSLSPVFLIDL